MTSKRDRRFESVVFTVYRESELNLMGMEVKPSVLTAGLSAVEAVACNR